MNEFMKQYYQKAMAEMESIADRHFVTKLAEAGFVFHSKQELAAFCTERLTSLAFEDNTLIIVNCGWIARSLPNG